MPMLYAFFKVMTVYIVARYIIIQWNLFYFHSLPHVYPTLFQGLYISGVKLHKFQGVHSNSMVACNLVKNR